MLRRSGSLRFRPSLELLEDRRVPALSVLSTGSTLAITGTPEAGSFQTLLVQDVGGDNFHVLDGATDLGTFHAARDLRLDLDSVADFAVVEVDLAGDTLPGSVLVNIGSGNPFVQVTNSTGNGTVGRDVLFSGGSGTEAFAITAGPGATLQLGGNVQATGIPVTTPIEDQFFLAAGVEVHGDVSTTRVTYTTIEGTVDGNLSALTIDKPCGMGFSVSGTVHGNLTATGGATNPGCFSLAVLLGATVDGDVTLHLTSGFELVESTASVGGNLRISAADSVSTNVFLAGTVDGSAFLDLGGSADTFSTLRFGGFGGFGGTVHGSMNVSSQSGLVNLFIGYKLFRPRPGVIDGDLNVHLGDGTNNLMIDGALGSKIGGTVDYHGGAGANTVSITGQNDFRLLVHTGGGDDTVAFAPDARVAFALIDFGKGPGTKTWIPPTVIDFRLILLNYP
jgi:hypothetical protein